MILVGDYCLCLFNENQVECRIEDSAAQFRDIYLDLGPGGGGEVTIRTLEGVGIQVRPLVVLHVRASMERLHAYSAGKPLGAQTGRAHSRGRGWSFTAQLTEKIQHSQRGGILCVVRSLHAKQLISQSYLHLLQNTIRQC